MSKTSSLSLCLLVCLSIFSYDRVLASSSETLSPKCDQVFLTTGDYAPVNFSWGSVQGVTNYFLDAGPANGEAAFSNQDLGNKTSAEVDAKVGYWRWGVSTKTSDGNSQWITPGLSDSKGQSSFFVIKDKNTAIPATVFSITPNKLLISPLLGVSTMPDSVDLQHATKSGNWVSYMNIPVVDGVISLNLISDQDSGFSPGDVIIIRPTGSDMGYLVTEVSAASSLNKKNNSVRATATFSWDKIPNAKGYKIYDNEGRVLEDGILGPDITTYSHSGFKAGIYRYFVSADVALGTCDTRLNLVKTIDVAVSDCEVSGLSGGVKAISDSCGEVDLSWPKIDNTYSYNIYNYNRSEKLKTVTGTSTKILGLPSGMLGFNISAIDKDTKLSSLDFNMVPVNVNLCQPEPTISSTKCRTVDLQWPKIIGTNHYLVCRNNLSPSSCTSIPVSDSPKYSDYLDNVGDMTYFVSAIDSYSQSTVSGPLSITVNNSCGGSNGSSASSLQGYGSNNPAGGMTVDPSGAANGSQGSGGTSGSNNASVSDLQLPRCTGVAPSGLIIKKGISDPRSTVKWSYISNPNGLITSSGQLTEDCQWTCQAGYKKMGNTCTSDKIVN